jgi:hypothetical protein
VRQVWTLDVTRSDLRDVRRQELLSRRSLKKNYNDEYRLYGLTQPHPLHVALAMASFLKTEAEDEEEFG